jgi:hypothetical protein
MAMAATKRSSYSAVDDVRLYFDAIITRADTHRRGKVHCRSKNDDDQHVFDTKTIKNTKDGKKIVTITTIASINNNNNALLLTMVSR